MKTNELINRWKAADELYSALKEKLPIEQLTEKITAHINAEKPESINSLMRTIYYISMAVSDEDTFDGVYKALKEYGIDYSLFSNSEEDYYIYKICSENEADKYIADNFRTINLFNTITPVALIAAVKNVPAKKLEQLIRFYNKSYMEGTDIDEYIYYLSLTNQTDILLKICETLGIGMTASLNIAIGNPDLFYGCLAKKYPDKLPDFFKDNDRFYTVEEIIPLIFHSKGFQNIFCYGFDITYADIAWYFFRNITSDNLRKIVHFFPEIETIDIIDMKFISEREDSSEFCKAISDHIGKEVTLTGTGYIDISAEDVVNVDNIKNFCDKYLQCKIKLSCELLQTIIESDCSLLDYFMYKGAVFDISPDETISIIERTIAYNNTEMTDNLILAGLVTIDNMNEAINCAVASRSLKALNVLNRYYNNIIDYNNKYNDNN